jgi:CelD/BcsL family acetyltransferase involved in cellulose biosynthesis
MVTVEVSKILDSDALESDWRRLEAEVACGVFTTWTWVGTWLRRALRDRSAVLVRAKAVDRTIALGIFVRSWGFFRGVPVRRMHLHAVGRTREDQVHIEFNSLVCDPARLPVVLPAVVRELACHETLVWDHLVVSGATDFRPYQSAANEVGAAFLVSAVPAPYVDLNKLRSHGATYVGALNRKVRYDVRRAIGAYTASLGAPVIETAGSAAEALLWLEQLALLNRRRQSALGAHSSFASAYFLNFHRDLVERSWPTPNVALLRVIAGSTVIGYLYLLLDGRSAYLYQCGYDYSLLENRGQPGYACLPLAIEYALAHGYETFEFLGGPELYKRKLSNAVRSMYYLTIRQRTLLGRLAGLAETLGRRLKRA